MKNSDKFLALDSLRGIAAFIVFFGHFTGLFCSKAQMTYFTELPFLINGVSSVYLFFALSGFVLSYKFWSTFSLKKLIQAAILRYFRLLFIVFIAGLFVYILSMFHILYDSFDFSYRMFAPIEVSIKEIFFQNITVFFTGIHVDKVFWTMKVEYLGSIMTFGLVFIFFQIPKKHSMLLIIIFASYLAIQFTSLYRLQVMANFSLFFILGCLASKYIQHKAILTFLNKDSKMHFMLLCAYLLIFFTFFSIYPISPSIDQDPKYNKTFFLFYALMATFLVCGAICIKPIRLFLEFKPLVFFGKISFPFYAIHSLVFGSFNVWFLRFFHENHNLFIIILLFILDLIMCITVSTVLYKWDRMWRKFIVMLYCIIENKIK